MAGTWSLAYIHQRLGKPSDWVPSSAEEAEEFYERAIDLLKAGTKSGYQEVFVKAGGNSFEAKVYLRPHVQRSLGCFPSARLAAMKVFALKTGGVPAPPTPTKPRRKKGEGRAPRIRRRKGSGSAGVQVSRASPTTVAVAHLELEVSEESPEGSLVVGGVVP